MPFIQESENQLNFTWFVTMKCKAYVSTINRQLQQDQSHHYNKPAQKTRETYRQQSQTEEREKISHLDFMSRTLTDTHTLSFFHCSKSAMPELSGGSNRSCHQLKLQMLILLFPKDPHPSLGFDTLGHLLHCFCSMVKNLFLI